MAGYIEVRNWDEFQHYKDRNPPWIKLHRSLLNNYEFQCLQDASKAHLMGIWLLASQLDNRVPADAEWIGQRIAATTPVDLSVLIEKGFLLLDGCEQSASKPQAKCSPETEAETEEEVLSGSRTKNEYPEEFESVWRIYPKRVGGNPKKKALHAWNARIREGHTAEEISEGVERYARFCRASGKEGTEFVKLAATFFGPDKQFQETWQTAPKQVRGFVG